MPTPPVLPTPALATPTPTLPVLTHPATEPQPAPANPTARKSKGQRKGKGEGGASDPTPGETVELPANAPRWLVDNIAWLSTHDLGCHYTSLLAALVKLETTFGFKEDTYSTLPSEHRPLQVHDWIRSGRTRAKKIPKVLDVEKYADEWQRWWDSLQPEWRRRGPDKKWRAGGDATYGGNEEWGVLDRPGPNGCLSVMGSLYFWGVCEDQSTGVKECWLDAVQDVVWMLEGLTASME
ncbi:hypothetical protein B0H13DRAFT_1635086 [Mycena leptocephala]|nr:hypothetical protein B0H13DRAFT_1635086 [Mycena leptocephala]